MSPMCGKLFRKLHFHHEDQMKSQDAKNAKQTDHQSPITSHPADRYHCGLCDQLANPALPLTLSRHAPKCPLRGQDAEQPNLTRSREAAKPKMTNRCSPLGALGVLAVKPSASSANA